MDAMRDLAVELADIARGEARRATQAGMHVRRKEDGSPVTDVDVAIEQQLRLLIHQRCPEHGVLGEEFGHENAQAAWQWIIDPIDGTVSFMRGVPLYGTCLALRHEGRTVLGLIDLPGLDERYLAVAGQGTTLNGEPVDIAPADHPQYEIVVLGARWNFDQMGHAATFDRLSTHYPLTRTWCDAFGHGLAIRGAVGAMVDYGVKLWDIAATQLLVEEAGGRFVLTHDGPLYGAVFGKPSMVEDVLARLRP